MQIQVNVDGRVSVVHPGSKSTRRVGINSQMWFRVRWAQGVYPAASSGCAAFCDIAAGSDGDTCVCDVSVTSQAVFTDSSAVPAQAEVEERLRIGSAPPEHFDDGTYTLCSTPACQAAAPSVRVFTQGTTSSPTFDDRTIFSVVVNRTSASNGTTLYLANKESLVTIADASSASIFGTHRFSFRNPPKFMTLVDPTQRDAIYETDALLDHLFYHQVPAARRRLPVPLPAAATLSVLLARPPAANDSCPAV